MKTTTLLSFAMLLLSEIFVYAIIHYNFYDFMDDFSAWQELLPRLNYFKIHFSALYGVDVKRIAIAYNVVTLIFIVDTITSTTMSSFESVKNITVPHAIALSAICSTFLFEIFIGDGVVREELLLYSIHTHPVIFSLLSGAVSEAIASRRA